MKTQLYTSKEIVKNIDNSIFVNTYLMPRVNSEKIDKTIAVYVARKLKKAVEAQLKSELKKTGGNTYEFA